MSSATTHPGVASAAGQSFSGRRRAPQSPLAVATDKTQGESHD